MEKTEEKYAGLARNTSVCNFFLSETKSFTMKRKKKTAPASK